MKRDVMKRGAARRDWRAWLLGTCLAALTGAACAQQSWPVRPVRMIVPSAAGGGTDIVARAIAPKLSEYLGQQVVVENRPGAAMIIGGEAVARAAPDGYTLLMAISTLTIHPSMHKKLCPSTPSATSSRSRRWSRSPTS